MRNRYMTVVVVLLLLLALPAFAKRGRADDNDDERENGAGISCPASYIDLRDMVRNTSASARDFFERDRVCDGAPAFDADGDVVPRS